MADIPQPAVQVDPTPPAPNRNAQTNPLTYSQVADTWAADLNRWNTDLNTLSLNVNFNSESAYQSSAEALSSAKSALDSRNTAVSAANFAGYWSDLTGPAFLPLSVRHNGRIWTLLQSVGDVTQEEPGVSAAWAAVSQFYRDARTSNTMIAIADFGNIIDITSGTFAQTFDDAESLGYGFYCYIKNSGTGSITLTPTSGLIDGLSSYIMYPGEMRMFMCDGVDIVSYVLQAFSVDFDASGNFVTPPGYSGFDGYCWAGGGGGVNYGGGANYGGGGGACVPFNLKNSMLASVVAMTIGAGGASGAAGGNTSFGSLVIAYGGGGAGANTGGGGGGTLSAGNSNSVPGAPVYPDASSNSIGGFGGGYGRNGAGAASASVYGGGGGDISFGGSSIYGGGGGGNAGGSSVYAGAGGDSGQNGNVPAGGGGVGTTTGGSGRIRIKGVF